MTPNRQSPARPLGAWKGFALEATFGLHTTMAAASSVDRRLKQIIC
jgi:hypothetical protein